MEFCPSGLYRLRMVNHLDFGGAGGFKEELEMRTLIVASFVTTYLFITIFSVSAAIDPNMILYFTFDEQLDGRKVEDMTGGGNNGKLRFGATITNEPAEVYKGTGALKIFNNSRAETKINNHLGEYQNRSLNDGTSELDYKGEANRR